MSSRSGLDLEPQILTPNTQVPSEVALGRVRPNPFSTGTTIPFSTRQPGSVQLSIYDVTGRLIRTVVDRPLTLGQHEATWDARDQSGVRVAAGLYFVRLRTGGEAHTQKVVVAR